jgi:hypothetical protein
LIQNFYRRCSGVAGRCVEEEAWGWAPRWSR